jgi:hypothetical protein
MGEGLLMCSSHQPEEGADSGHYTWEEEHFLTEEQLAQVSRLVKKYRPPVWITRAPFGGWDHPREVSSDAD